MQLSVKGKQVDIGDSLRGHISASLKDVVGKYFSSPIDAVVTMSREAHLFRADVSVHIGRGLNVQCNASAADPYAAFDEAAVRLNGRLRRYKNRIKDHHSAERTEDAVIASAFVLNANENTEEGQAHDNPVVVAEMTTPIESLTVSEAVMRLDLGELPALLFRNSSHGGLNMIYRRTDGHIGWVDPAQNAASQKKAG